MLNHWVCKALLFPILSISAVTQTPSSAVSAPVAGNQNMAKLTIRAMVVDRDLNVKPIPKFAFTLQPSSGQSVSEPLTATTKVDGTVEMQVVPAQYHIVSMKPLTFEGKQYSWDMQAAVTVPETTLELSNDNANILEGQPSSVDDLTSVFKKYRDAVVTVWAEVGAGHGTGFIADPSGLVITNQHVVTTSDYIAVQFDEKRLLPAKVLAADSTKDVAVLWVDFSRVPEAHAAPLLKEGDIPAEEGERVFTIGSPLHQSKVMTTGIVSKVEARAVISDININPGNSGGPLFNSRGRVIGITTFGDVSRRPGFPGISGIIRIEQALPLLEAARTKMSSIQKPSSEFLLEPPVDSYPLDAIKANANVEKFKLDPYIFGVGDYDVAFITPIVLHRGLASEVKAGREKEKRNSKNANAVQGTFQPLDSLKGWAEYVGEYEPVLLVQASPRLKESFLSAFGRGMAASHGYAPGPAKLHFKTDFYKMKLLCGTQEVKPLFPGKVERIADEHNSVVNITDATFDGLYKYPADAIQETCQTVTLELFSEKDPNNPKIKVLDKKTIHAVAGDFAPYLALHVPSALVPQTANAGSPVSAQSFVQPTAAIPASAKPHQAASIEPQLRPAVMTSIEVQPPPAVPKQEAPASSAAPAPAATGEGTASITSDPDGAEIFVDSVGRGHAPALLKLKPGKHKIQLVADGYKDWVGEIDVKDSSIVNVTGKLEK